MWKGNYSSYCNWIVLLLYLLDTGHKMCCFVCQLQPLLLTLRYSSLLFLSGSSLSPAVPSWFLRHLWLSLIISVILQPLLRSYGIWYEIGCLIKIIIKYDLIVSTHQLHLWAATVNFTERGLGLHVLRSSSFLSDSSAICLMCRGGCTSPAWFTVVDGWRDWDSLWVMTGWLLWRIYYNLHIIAASQVGAVSWWFDDRFPVKGNYLRVSLFYSFKSHQDIEIYLTWFSKFDCLRKSFHISASVGSVSHDIISYVP